MRVWGRWTWGFVLACLGAAAGTLQAQGPASPGENPNPKLGNPAPANSDLELVEKLLQLRRDYQKTLEQLRVHYLQAGDVEKSRWVEEELRQWHRIPKRAYRLDLDIPPPNLSGNQNVPEANRLYTWALSYKDRGWGTDYLDNQRRAELLLQQLLSQYPQSDKISDAAYMLGEVYESKAYRHYRRAALYYERCFQWNPRTQFDARLRAARLYDRQVADRAKAIELYRQVTTHETDPRRIQEATRRLTEMTANR